MNLKICFIGAGNLATQLSKALNAIGFDILQIYSRTADSAKMLADEINTNYTNDIKKLDTNADIYFVAINDAVIEEVLSEHNFRNKLIVHCSGSLPLSILEKHSENCGVFYPLQTFSKTRNVDFLAIPIFIESHSAKNKSILLEIANKISGSVSVLNSAKRKSLHIAAVFACNFVNHMYAVSSEIIGREGIPFEVLKPLIAETAQKVQTMEPKNAQTGPAVRFDENIISMHLKELEGLNNYQELYNSISKGIFEFHKKQE